TSRFGYDPTFTYKIPDNLKSFMDNIVRETQKEWIDIKMDIWEYEQKRSEFEDKIWMDYEFLQLMDRMSQIVTINTPEDKTKVTLGPIRKTQDSKGIQMSFELPGDGSVIVDPFPFKEEIKTSVKVRRIPNKKYESHAELAKTIEKAPYETVEWNIIRK